MAEPPEAPAHLTPSILGTKEYWDTAYTSELSAHLQSPDGAAESSTVWFAETAAAAKTLAYLAAHAPDGPDTSFLDLGAGNGELLFELRESARWRGGRGRMLGVDYADAAVRLAAARGAARGLGAAAVEFRRWDVLRGDVSAVVEGGAVARRGGWDVVLDKGTFDAVSLSGERLAADDAGMAFEAYPARVARLVRPGGLVLVTSCNWTEEELARWFVRGGDGMLARHDRIAYPTFSFGGRKGQSVCTLVFRRVEEGS